MLGWSPARALLLTPPILTSLLYAGCASEVPTDASGGSSNELSFQYTWQGQTQTRTCAKVDPNGNRTGLIVSLHGAGGSGTSACSESMNSLPASIRVVLACPSGRSGSWKAFSGCVDCASSGSIADEMDSEDVEFIDQLISHLITDQSIPANVPKTS